MVGLMDFLNSLSFSLSSYPFVKVRYYSCCWLYRREVGRLGFEKSGTRE